MKIVVVGLGIQGNKRLKIAGNDAASTVDPVVRSAGYKKIEEVPLNLYDAALVSVPDDAKYPIIKYLLSSGKHVLVEKPLLISPGKIEELRALASKKGLACYTAYNHRFEPHIVRLKETIEKGVLGPLYLAKFFYGNGTARDVKQSAWRDQGPGVITDLGSHLLDTALFLFGKKELKLELCRAENFENQAPDYAMLASTGKPLLQFEMTFLSWKNTFRADIYGEKGSAHIDGLCKWGPSVFSVRQRVLPSGKPAEESETLNCVDPTWEKEYAYFKQLCLSGKNNLDNDIRIQSMLSGLTEPVLK